jgi:hypothetical protein
MASRKVSLSVNGSPVELDYFVQGFIDHTVAGILSGLKSTGEIKSLDISIDGDKVKINLNDNNVPLNPFPNSIVKNTIIGMVSSLKGVSEANKVNISIRR